MLRRFSLYGFLKNQRYFEPFLVLAFLSKGLDFFEIGLLLGFRELAINLMEVPSGLLADLHGRRRAMMLSFSAYIGSFALFAAARSLPLLFAAMALFAVGEVFRTGTHKAMIFAWLRSQGREAERTRVYGYTRSWSKLGSALSVILAPVLVLATGSYTAVFLWSIPPYLLNLLNFAGYPAYLDGEPSRDRSLRHALSELVQVFRLALGRPALRRLLAEGAAMGGLFKSSKDVLQPVLKAAAASWLAGLWGTADFDEVRRTALLVGPVYLALHLLSAWTSRRAHALAERLGGEESAARACWWAAVAVFALLLPSLWWGYSVPAILGFVALHVLQDLWRPVLVARIDAHGSAARGATLLSIESQARSLATVILAPLLGWALDAVQAHGPGGPFWPTAALGLLLSLPFLLLPGPGRSGEAPAPGD